MKLILDTSDLNEIRYFNTYYPIAGVTTNPSILARERGDVLALLRAIREEIGAEKELHVQVVETEYARMVEEAKAIAAFLGAHTYVKIPATDQGLRAVMTLSGQGYGVTVTAVLSAAQALLASNAGAAYVAPYVSRLENLCESGIDMVADIAAVFASAGSRTEILSASFKTAREVLDAALAGSHAATIAPEVMRRLLAHPATDTSIAGFSSDWAGAFGKVTLLELLSRR